MNMNLQNPDAKDLLTWVYETYGERAAMSTAFGPSGVVMMHLASQINPGARVFFVDTGFHFAETLQMVERVQARMAIRVEIIEPLLSVTEQAQEFGDELPVLNPDRCCGIRKIEPTQRMLDDLDAWITALRRDQGPSRANTPVLSVRTVGERSVIKLNPMVEWTRRDIWRHIAEHDLPYNPLHDQNYPSVGCWPCTQPAGDSTHERAGRWSGRAKTECGLHTLI